MKTMKNLSKRTLALLLALVLCLGMVNMTTFAAEGEEPQHLETCGYSCTHEHTEECEKVVTVDSTDPADGYQPAVEAQEEVNCPNEGCDGTEEGHVEHVDAVEAKAEVMGSKEEVTYGNCTHDCATDGCTWVCAEDCPTLAKTEEPQPEPEEPALKASLDWNGYETCTMTVEGTGTLDFNTVVGNDTIGFLAYTLGSRLVGLKVTGDVTIGYAVFAGCAALKTVELTDGVVIGERAFAGCPALSELTLDGVTIGKEAFGYTTTTNPYTGVSTTFDCGSLTSVTLKNVASIGESAFKGCVNLKSLTLDNVNPNGLNNNAFYINMDSNPVETLTLRNMETTGIAYSTLYGLKYLTLENVGTVNGKVTEGTKVINNGAFKPGIYSTGLETVTCINVGEIGTEAFYTSSLTSITFDKPVVIGEKAFYGCKSLTTVTMNEGGAIGSYAFQNCSALERINGLSKVSSISGRAFEGCTKLDLTTERISASTQLGYSSIFLGVDYLEARMKGILEGQFSLNLVPEAEELTVPSGWTDSKTGELNSTDPDSTQITKAASWADEDKTVADVELQFSHSDRPGMDFLFIVDLSNSMSYTGAGNTMDPNGLDSKFYAMQSKLIDVTTKLVTNEDYNNRVAFVTFGGYVSSSKPCYIESRDFTNDPDVVALFEGLQGREQNTDYVTAFTEAKKLVDAHDSSRELAVIFISDGRPTYEGKTKLSTTELLYSTIDKTAAIAREFEAQGVNVFGVLQSVPSNEYGWAEKAMTTICTENLFFPANNTQEFSEAVNKAIGAAYGTYTVVDTVGADFELDVTSIKASDDTEYKVGTDDEGNTTITWTIYGVPFTTYTLSFKENLKAELVDKVGTFTYDTNLGDATVNADVNSVDTPQLSRTVEPPYVPPVIPTVDYYTLTVNYVYEDGTTAAETVTRDQLTAGTAYSVASPEIEGYTADQSVVSGTMPSHDVVVTVVYTPVDETIEDEEPPLAEIPDEEPPLADLPKDPEEEIPDEEPPLADVPKTGDHTNRFLVMAAVSGMCLLTLLSGRKKEDEA